MDSGRYVFSSHSCHHKGETVSLPSLAKRTEWRTYTKQNPPTTLPKVTKQWPKARAEWGNNGELPKPGTAGPLGNRTQHRTAQQPTGIPPKHEPQAKKELLLIFQLKETHYSGSIDLTKWKTKHNNRRSVIHKPWANIKGWYSVKSSCH